MVTLEQARANATPIDWTGYQPPQPDQLRSGQRVRVLRDHDLLVIHSAEELDCVRKAGVLCQRRPRRPRE